MPAYREFNRKIASLRSMRRITRTMKMVSAGHLRRAQGAIARAGDYQRALRHWIEMAGAPPPAPAPKEGQSHALILVISSNRGLCGGYNARLSRAVLAWLAQEQSSWKSVRAAYIGNRAANVLKGKVPMRRIYTDVTMPPRIEDAVRIGTELDTLFHSRKFGHIFLAYTQFVSAMNCRPVVEPLLPFALPAAPATEQKGAAPRRLLMEPEPSIVAPYLWSQCVHYHVFRAMLESSASEYAARMMAMDVATTNIDKLISSTVQLRDTARQASITRELIEIVSGAESLAG